MMKAKRIKFVNEDFPAEQVLWELDTPVKFNDGSEEEAEKETNFVVTSAVNAPFSGPETYIFPTDKDGNILDWLELHGSFRGYLDHEEAITGAGFEIEED